MAKNRMKELSYYLFFGFMIFAKGIGLDSGDRLYYILSAAACACVGCKLILTKYNKKQLSAMILLGLIAFVAYRNSGRMGILLSIFTIVGMKDMDVKKLFRLGAVIYTGSFGFTVLAAKLGMISNPMVVHEKAGMEVIRWGMGYSTGNIFHVSYFILTVLLCYTWGKKYDWKKMAALMAGNLLVFLFSLSYTGAAVTAFYLLLNLYAVKRKRLSVGEKIVCQLPLPLCLLFSFGMPFLLQYSVVQKIDSMLNARLTFSAYYLQNQPITMFGTRMKDVPNFWVIMDNGFVYIFMTFGIVVFALFCIGYAVMIARCSGICGGKRKKGQEGSSGDCKGAEAEDGAELERLPELAMIFSFLLYGIMEQFISNAFMNVSLVFMGEVLFGKAEPAGEKKTAIWKNAAGIIWSDMHSRNRLQGIISICAGVAVLIVYLAAVPMKEYIEVPLDSLDFVDAQSVQVHITNEEGTKDYLKEQMGKWKELMQDEETASEALAAAGLEERMTAAELTAAMEYGLPQAVHSSREYVTFRIRLLELYTGIEDSEYAVLLKEFMGAAEKRLKEQNPADGNMIVDQIYGERISKSSGTDRIEHMSSEREYTVEKSGNIVRIEYMRNGLFGAFAGAVLGYVVAAVAITGKNVYDRRKKNEKQ